ncbi:MAG TPA: FAD-dependent oxidoreductase [Pseudomonadales bacterium]|nr:FAD-dependent oxidoreductase [Pseudomonadales bacterium]
MARWECIVCGWVYDEEKGWPDDGIAPGTPWEQVPEDFLCPECGAPKEDFVLLDSPGAVETATGPAAQPQPRRLVVIGTGLAGYSFAREFRKLDTSTPLLLITADDGRAYSKPMLSTGFTRALEPEQLATADADTMAQTLNATIRTHARVTAIDTVRRELQLADGSVEAWEKLVIAWGAEVIQPPLAGDAAAQVHAVNNLQDYAKWRGALANGKARKVLLIGAGLIGSEFCNDLANAGISTEVVDPLGWCVATLLPEPLGRALQRALEARGARFHFGTVAHSIDQARSGAGIVATLADGGRVEADLALSAVGVRPHIALARAAGLAVNRGIVVDRLLQASVRGVYVLGDCAEVEGHVLHHVAPLMACARSLAQTLAGNPVPVGYPGMAVTLKTPACPLVVAAPPAGVDGAWSITGTAPDFTAEFRSPDGVLRGFALSGAEVEHKARLQLELPPLLA